MTPFNPNDAVEEAFDPLEKMRDLRARVLAKEPVSPEEYRQVLESLRRSRTAEPQGKGKKKGSNGVSASPVPDLLGGL